MIIPFEGSSYVKLNIDKVFKEKTEELSSPHYFMAMNKADYDERVQYAEIENVIMMDNSEINYGGKTKVNSLILDLDGKSEIAPVKIIGESILNPGDSAIYIPFYGQLIGYQLGDTIEVKTGGVVREYLITGLTQSTMNGGTLALLTLDGYEILMPDYERILMFI